MEKQDVQCPNCNKENVTKRGFRITENREKLHPNGQKKYR